MIIEDGRERYRPTQALTRNEVAKLISNGARVAKGAVKGGLKRFAHAVQLAVFYNRHHPEDPLTTAELAPLAVPPALTIDPLPELLPVEIRT